MVFFDALEQWNPVIVLASLTFFWLWEGVFPFFPGKDRISHAGRNLFIAVINGVFISLVFAGSIVWITGIAERGNIGLLRLFGLRDLPLTLVSFLVLDCWTYWWHRMNHRVTFLWRFHRMHHSDPSVDVTTATRFHFGEIIFSSLIRIALVPLLGIPLDAIILYDVFQLPIIAFHHANIALSPGADRLLQLFIVTPFMHKVHHSRERHETDSNYSSILSVWDRVFGSFVERDRHSSIQFGLSRYDADRMQSVAGLLRTPLFPPDER